MNAFRQEIIMNKYQAVIIGFGKAGKTLAVTLAKAGWMSGSHRTIKCNVWRDLY